MGKRHGHAAGVDAEHIDHRGRVHLGHLVKDVAIHVMPVRLVGVVPGDLGEIGPSFEQRPRVGAHLLERPDAEVVVFRRRPEEATQNLMAARVLGMPPEHHPRSTGPEREGREMLEQVLGGRVLTKQAPNRVGVDLPSAFAVDDEGVVDLARIDHDSGQVHAVQKPQTGVRDVEVEAVRRQSEHVVNRHRARWFKPFPTHRRVDQQPDASSIDTRRLDCRAARERCGVHKRRGLMPLAPFTNTGQGPQQPRAHLGALVVAGEAFIDRVGGNHLRRLTSNDGNHRNVGEQKIGVSRHQVPHVRRKEGVSHEPRCNDRNDRTAPGPGTGTGQAGRVPPWQNAAMLRAVSRLISGQAVGKISVPWMVPMSWRQVAATPAAISKR